MSSKIVHCELENLLGLPHREMTENTVASLDTAKTIKIHPFTKMCKRMFPYFCWYLLIVVNLLLILIKDKA